MPTRTYYQPGWMQSGIAPVVVVREKSGGRYEAGVFLLDTLCLGVKDAFHIGLDEAPPLEEFLKRVFRDMDWAEESGAWGRKLVEGAAAYARSLGLAPHKGYAKGARVFGGTRAEDCAVQFEFGRKGRPVYIQGPHESSGQAGRIIGILRAKCGDGNFDCDLVKTDHRHLPEGSMVVVCESGEMLEEPSDELVAFAGEVADKEGCNVAHAPDLGEFAGRLLSTQSLPTDPLPAAAGSERDPSVETGTRLLVKLWNLSRELNTFEEAVLEVQRAAGETNPVESAWVEDKRLPGLFAMFHNDGSDIEVLDFRIVEQAPGDFRLLLALEVPHEHGEECGCGHSH